MMEYIPQIIWAVVACLPSAVVGVIVWRMEKKMEQGFQEQATGAAIALGEATAMALKNGHTNGETEAALEYAREIKHKQKDFLTRQAAKSIT